MPPANSMYGTASTGAQDSIYLSSNATAPEGFAMSGSLFRGSGFWVPNAKLPSPRSDHGTVLYNATRDIYLMGGHDDKDNLLSRCLITSGVPCSFSITPFSPLHEAIAAAVKNKSDPIFAQKMTLKKYSSTIYVPLARCEVLSNP